MKYSLFAARLAARYCFRLARAPPFPQLAAHVHKRDSGALCFDFRALGGAELHVGVVPKRSQKLQTVECWSRNRKSYVNQLFFKNLRVFTQISRSPILVFFCLSVGREHTFLL